jgi:pyruvate decarboxylase
MSLSIMPSLDANAQDRIPLTTYLFTRLRQLGVDSLHGVPGDYNLTALDHVSASSLNWVGNCNELNAGYAADGYSRIKGVGALITAFGVGELSAINAIGGAYAEQAAVVHVVGTPPRSAQRAGICLHHTLGNGDYRVFSKMAKLVTVAQAELVDEKIAVEEIDRVLRECVVQSRPVYIELPTDMVNVPVDAQRLSTPINMSPSMNKGTEQAKDEVIQHILDRISKAKQPFLVVDGFTARWSIFSEIEQVVRILGWPTTSTPFGKSCIDETLPNFHGIYAGLAGRSVYKPWVDACDLVLRFGGMDSDVNTYGFSTLPSEKATINFHRDHVLFGDSGKEVEGVPIKSLLQNLIRRLTDLEANDKKAIPRMDPYPTHLGDPGAELAALPPTESKAPIEQHDFWRRISHFFREGDIIMTETGTPSVGSREFVLPRNARLINSSIWLSIGYMLGAAQGAALAIREIKEERYRENSHTEILGKESPQQNGEAKLEPNALVKGVLSSSTASGRTILFEGDGSFQMSAQELSTIIKHKLDLTLFLINNDGYTIERFIHGMKAHYNDVAAWRYLDAPNFFGGDIEQSPETDGDGHQGEEVLINGDDHNTSKTSFPSTKSKSPPRSSHSTNSQAQAPYRIQTYSAHTWGELQSILSQPSVQAGKGLCMIEVFMDREDAPESLKRLVETVGRRNSGESEKREDGNGEERGEMVREDKIVEERIVKAAG